MLLRLAPTPEPDLKMTDIVTASFMMESRESWTGSRKQAETCSLPDGSGAPTLNQTGEFCHFVYRFIGVHNYPTFGFS
jgi:hypothetical protein